MACLFLPFPMTLDDLEDHLPNAGLIKCYSTNICVNCHGASRGPSTTAELLVSVAVLICSSSSYLLSFIGIVDMFD